MEENKGEFSQENSKDERKMYPAKCSECGNGCEVPFEPIKGKPIKCKECFRKSSGNRFKKRLYDATCSRCNKQCKVPFRPNDAKPILCRDCYQAAKE
jgi:CxxC-x17-CxxC domain-containing protein